MLNFIWTKSFIPFTFLHSLSYALLLSHLISCCRVVMLKCFELLIFMISVHDTSNMVVMLAFLDELFL